MNGLHCFAKKHAVILFPVLAMAVGMPAASYADTVSAASSPARFTYADLADLAGPASLVARVRITKQAVVEPERSPGLAPGHVRLFVKASSQDLLAGPGPLAKTVRYLVDVPLDAGGRVPRLKGKTVLLFAHPVPGRPDELQLTAPKAQIPADEEYEARLRLLLAELRAPDAPPRLTRIRDILSVEGNLTGESETQLFIESDADAPLLDSLVHRPGMAPVWGVSWSELVDQAKRPPAHDSLAWYRLACTLPARLPQWAHRSASPAARVRAEQDYRLVMQDLGPCDRNRR